MDNEVESAEAVIDIPAKGRQVKPEHKAEWVRRFHQSASSYRKFSAAHGLRVATLRGWVVGESEARQQTFTPEFTEIKLPELWSPRPSGSVELSFANGNRLRIWGEISTVLLEQLLRVC